MKRDDRITLRVSTAEKAQIEEWVDQDPDFNSSSQFLRAAARAYAKNNKTSINREEVIEAVDVALSPVTENLEEIKSQLASVEAATKEPDDDVTRLTEQIVEELPVHPDNNLPGLGEVPENIGEGTLRAARTLSNPTAWAAYYSRDISDVREALSLAHAWYPEVQYAEVGGTRRWYKTRELHNHNQGGT